MLKLFIFHLIHFDHIVHYLHQYNERMTCNDEITEGEFRLSYPPSHDYF